MRKSLLFIAMILAATTTIASDAIVEQRGYVLPSTSIEITLTVCKEEVIVGPYAKYSQQLLGISAPLNSKVSYTIVDTNIETFREADPSGIYKIASPKEAHEAIVLEQKAEKTSNKSPLADIKSLDHITFRDLGFEPLVSTITSQDGATLRQEKSFDQMAEEGAQAIFTLRKRRFDLITGDMGEHVFGEGLKAALDEIARLENEYLSLFIGKKRSSFKEYQFNIVPEVDKSSYILSRFSQEKGIRDITQMDGSPLIVTLSPEGKVKEQKEVKPEVVQELKKGEKPIEEVVVMRYRVADFATCKLFCASTLLESKRVAIYQYGATIELKEEVK